MLNFLANPGDSFYVAAFLDVGAGSDGFVDAFNTLTAEFVAPPEVLANIQSASVSAVPEPSSLAIAWRWNGCVNWQETAFVSRCDGSSSAITNSQTEAAKRYFWRRPMNGREKYSTQKETLLA